MSHDIVKSTKEETQTGGEKYKDDCVCYGPLVSKITKMSEQLVISAILCMLTFFCL